MHSLSPWLLSSHPSDLQPVESPRDSVLAPLLFFIYTCSLGRASLVAQTVEKSAYNAGDWSGRSPGESNGYPL